MRSRKWSSSTRAPPPGLEGEPLRRSTPALIRGAQVCGLGCWLLLGGCSPSNSIDASDVGRHQAGAADDAGPTAGVDASDDTADGSGDLSAACAIGQARCDAQSTCADLARDPWNCGWCGHRCPPRHECRAGLCGERCAEGLSWCDGGCVDLTRDPQHCGDCAGRCNDETPSCVQGECVGRCPAGQRLCGEFCVDTERNVHHCGGCGQPCPTDQQCAAGRCQSTCVEPFSRCGDECLDLRNNRGNCGECGRACPAHLICQASGCVCPLASTQECAGACVNVLVDDRHCGGCGQPCPPDQVCAGGECTCELEGWGVCGGRCVNLWEDPLNCGECGQLCPAAEECVHGHCGGVSITVDNDAYGHHGDCGGSWNDCRDAETCARWACEFRGYTELLEFGRSGMCSSGEFRTCHLFRARGDLEENWGTQCGVMGVSDIYCK